jgi:predicted Rossmann fold flavoprotein
MKNFDVIIIGAGAAGLMCAIQAGKRGRKVLVIDHAKNVGEKIRISGGGRCNFTNLKITNDNFLSQNPYFAVSALKRFTQNDFIQMVKDHQIAYHEKTLGQLFCDSSSKQIIQMLLDECHKFDVKIWLETKVTNIEKTDHFTLNTNQEKLTANSLVIATGGLSIPKMGATDFGYLVAKKFELKIIPPIPALVPLLLEDNLLQETKNLAGVAVAEAIASCNKKSFKEAILFTHKGLSGPVILQISSYWNKGDEIKINFVPQIDVYSWLEQHKQTTPKQDIGNLIATILPKSLAIYLTSKAEVNGILATISKQKLKTLANLINSWSIVPVGTEGFAKAEVTKGGIDTDEISSKTFECKKVLGLFFIGEVLDVTGHLGGYNFQWAWSSGFAAGQFV